MQSHTARIGITQPLCATCATALAPDMIACPICGRIVHPQAPVAMPLPVKLEEPLPHTQPCPNCGLALLPGARGCPACGRGNAMVLRTLLPAAGDILHERYRIIGPLSGGMSTLLLAEDMQQNKRVILKLAMDTVQQRALKREEKILNEVLHPSLPSILDNFLLHGQNVLVLEYVEGYDLEQRLTHTDRVSGHLIIGKAYPLMTVLHWGAQLAQLLDLLEQFSSGAIIHHDIKPANIICISPENTLVLIDWGAARHSFSASLVAGNPGVDVSGTYGTVGYAPPEQYRGQSTMRSDVYGLAATLYHLATNDDPSEHPFEFPHLNKLGAFGWLLSQALAHNPNERPSAVQFGTKLMALLRLQGETLRAPDGTSLPTPEALADWCCIHWAAARSWLARGLPEALLLWWPTYSHDVDMLHSISQRRPINDEDLDQALALIDVRYKDAQAMLAIKTPEIHFDRVSGSAPVQRTAEIRNTGRRMFKPSFHSTPTTWLQITPADLCLLPGTNATLTLTVYPDQLWSWREQRLSISLKQGEQELGQLHCMVKPGIGGVLGFVSSWFGRISLSIGLLLLLSILLVFKESQPVPGPIYPTPLPIMPTVTPWLPSYPSLQPPIQPDLPSGPPRFYTTVLSTDWRSMLYVARQQGADRLSPELERQAYENGQNLLAASNLNLAAEAFRAAGNYADAASQYRQILSKLAEQTSGYYPLEEYRLRRILAAETASNPDFNIKPFSEPVPHVMSWTQKTDSSHQQYLAFSESAVWLLNADNGFPTVAWSLEGSTVQMKSISSMPHSPNVMLVHSIGNMNYMGWSDGDTVQIIDLENGELAKSWKGNGQHIELLDISSDLDSILLTTDLNAGRYIVKVQVDSGHMQNLGLFMPGTHARISADGKTTVVLLTNGDAYIWSGEKQILLPSNGDPMIDFAIRPDNAGIVFSRADGALRFFDLKRGQSSWVTQLPEQLTGPLSFSTDGNNIAVSTMDRLWILDAYSGMMIHNLYNQGKPILQQTFSEDREYIVAQDAIGRVMLWKLGSGQ